VTHKGKTQTSTDRGARRGGREGGREGTYDRTIQLVVPHVLLVQFLLPSIGEGGIEDTSLEQAHRLSSHVPAQAPVLLTGRGGGGGGREEGRGGEEAREGDVPGPVGTETTLWGRRKEGRDNVEGSVPSRNNRP